MQRARSTRLLTIPGVLVTATTLILSGGTTAFADPAPTTPFISEIHYDNVGTDTGEAIEVEGPVGFDLTGWQIVLYNGASGAAYDTRTLTGVVPAAGVIVETYPSNGIQNGSPDGVALVAPDGDVAEFLTYEGTFTAVGGPADGRDGVDVGVQETASTPTGHSLQKIEGSWQAPAASTFGVRNAASDPDPDPTGCTVTVDHTIAEVQGTGAATPLAGSRVTVEGIVTADHRTGGYNGVYVQTAGSGAERPVAAGSASDGIFVYLTTNTANHPTVAIGDRVRVSGTASEFNGLTQLTIAARTDVQVCEQGAPLPAPVPVELPLDEAARESVESMLVAPVGAYSVSEVYNTNRYGEVALAAGDQPARTPTDVARPGSDTAQALAAENKLRRLLVDDGRTTNLATAGLLPPYVSPASPLRVGDQVEAFGPSVLSYGFNEWRLQPTRPVDADTAPAARTTFKTTNPRTAGPVDVGGDLRVASFNVLNYFVHFGGDARGAADEAALAKQEAKIVSAITALNADVVALEEIENSVRFNAEDPQQALKRLVAALNGEDGAGTWDYVRTPTELPGATEQDVITTAIIFKPAKAQPKGPSRSVNDETVWSNAREPIAQTFTAGSVDFIVVANHFKSKSGAGSGDNADAGDGQGGWNGDRVRQAGALAAFVEQVKADSETDNVLLLGDFNAYTQEDPMQVLYDEDYRNLNDTGKTSYVFNGESGSLDHALASPSLASRVTGVDVWQINAVESYAFQYDGLAAFFAPDPYRASDHNPLVVGIDTGSGTGPVDLQLLSINDFHGRLESPATVGGQPVGGAAQVAGLVNQLRAENPNTAFVSAGDNIGASTFISAIDDDNPTIDALNQAGLLVSAVGNHEFDKGIADLTGRVTDRADFPHLGANVYRGDTRALPAYSVDTIGGVRVGFIGVVTEQTASLVSPDGIAGITFRDPVAEANLVAGQLKDGNPDNGEAEVVVLLAHEGAATENIDSPEALANDPVFGDFTRADAAIDVIFSGHTHQPYAFEVPVPGTDKLRPIVQAEDYGKRLGKVTLTFDPETGSITSTDASLVDVVGAPQDPAVAEIVAAAKVRAQELGQRKLGEITADIRRAYTDGNEDRGKESTLGNFIADVQLAGTRDAGRGGAQIAFMNPGGLRADLLYGEDGTVTYAEAFAVQPFANDVVTKTYTGAEIKQVLEQQWQPAGASRPVLWLGVSEGFSYTYDPEAAPGSRITSMELSGTPIDPAGSYRVTVNSFLAAGGDNFTTLGGGTNLVTTGDNDLTMLVSYFAANSPVTADTEPRSSVGQGGPQCTTTITGKHSRPLLVTTGLTCVENATIAGPVSIAAGASLRVTGGTINGPVSATRPVLFDLSGTKVSGPVTVAGATGDLKISKARINGPLSLVANLGGVRVDGVTVSGPVVVTGNSGSQPVVVAANTISGPLACSGNTPAPVNEGRANTVRGPAAGQCARL
ncbi:ExeM/NucH family extracellular endonuclease [Micromonospora sediminimaris]|uniref:Multifunctional nuclease/2',3'-cyclic-nucleotide 2'-phosphodiesterase/5'-nucleotidase/3'-nucleotidase n=1 Tax=Micromonospora sediminimaris TaxID=547162 RepID=A0A9W5UW35_9ACTN|nr:ExeM/NucH family extracellular endonuclease [Micromonospora sediminimaris]GIJ35680.1 multifunctional nuclease/2',3'-cyclic-nucleotide 2'-phosphodiesterase/5'-nucleotidase/3'-nucleotidase [Micromonospora sediminimaris]SFD75940.1 5'-nucleotidase [Micromonospora sediminimaris]